MATVKDIRDASRADKDKFAQQKLGVTFYKQGIKGPMATKDGPNAPLRQYQEKKATPTPKAKPTPPVKKSYSAGDHQRGQSTKTTYSAGDHQRGQYAEKSSGKTTSGPPQIGSGGRVMGSKAEEAGRMAIKRRQSARTSDKITGSNIPSVQPPPKKTSSNRNLKNQQYVGKEKWAISEIKRKPVSEEYLTELKRRVNAANSPLGSVSRLISRMTDKLSGRY